VDGKSFGDGNHFDSATHYGKVIFAHKVVRPLARSNTAAFLSELCAIYGGRTGYLGGSQTYGNTILPDGSNINPVATKILQAKLRLPAKMF
jgi:hypothetical protein